MDFRGDAKGEIVDDGVGVTEGAPMGGAIEAWDPEAACGAASTVRTMSFAIMGIRAVCPRALVRDDAVVGGGRGKV